MNSITRSGLVAGAISGEVIVLLILVNTILIRDFARGNPGQYGSVLGVWEILYPLLIISVFEGGGIFSAWLIRKEVTTGKSSLIAGFITGITIGIIFEIMWIANIISLVSHTVMNGSGYFAGYENIVLTIGLLIILAVMGGVLSAFGSYIYSVRKPGA